MMDMNLTGKALAIRLEQLEVEALRQYAAARKQIFPERITDQIDIAGGVAAFTGENSPLNEAKAFGVGASAGPEEFDALEEFFSRHGVPARFAACPFTDPEALAEASRRGYAMLGMESMLWRSMEGELPACELPDGVEICIVQESERDAWTRVITTGFFDIEEPGDDDLEMARTTFASAVNVSYLALCDGEPAAAGQLMIHEGGALLSGTAALPRFRGRGLHTALIARRLADAAAKGCDIAAFGAEPGSVSHRNAERAGFRIAYSRMNLASPGRN